MGDNIGYRLIQAGNKYSPNVTTNASVVLGNTRVGSKITNELSLLDSKVQNKSVCIVNLLYDQVTYVCTMYVCMYLSALGRSVLGLRHVSEEKRRASAKVFPLLQCQLRQTLHSHVHTFCWSLCGVTVAVNGHNHSSWAHVNLHSHSVTTPTMIFNK